MTAKSLELVRFEEVQRWTQWWLWSGLIPTVGIVWWLFLAQMLSWSPFPASSPTWSIVLLAVVFVLAGVLLPLLFLVGHLRAIVGDDRVIVRYFPIWTRTIALNDILDCQAVTYSPIGDYGGWGIRYGWQGWAYNVKGDRGVKLTLRKGAPLLIGSQRAEELADAINAVRRAAWN
jgi:hypothetical protein